MRRWVKRQTGRVAAGAWLHVAGMVACASRPLSHAWLQDSSFIHTSPLSCVGLWWALEDCTKDNGCLWAMPGADCALQGARASGPRSAVPRP